MAERPRAQEPQPLTYSLNVLIANATTLVGGTVEYQTPHQEGMTDEEKATHLQEEIQTGVEAGEVLVVNTSDGNYTSGIYWQKGELKVRTFRLKIYGNPQHSSFTNPELRVTVNEGQLRLSMKGEGEPSSSEIAMEVNQASLTKLVKKEGTLNHLPVTTLELHHRVLWDSKETGNTGKEQV